MHAEELKFQWLAHLQKRTAVREPDERWIQITPPFANDINDLDDIYIRQIRKNVWKIADCGEILKDCGRLMNTAEEFPQDISAILQKTFGIGIKNGELTARCAANELPDKICTFIQAAAAVRFTAAVGDIGERK